jgi:sulfur transfer protein SufE
VSLVSDIYSGHTAEEIISNDKNLMEELDLGNILSMNRRNGAYNMLNMVKEHAKLFI